MTGVEQDLLSSDDEHRGGRRQRGRVGRGFATYPSQDERERAGRPKSAVVAKSPKWADSAKAICGRALEEAWNFASSTSLCRQHCSPKAVGVWVKNARKGVPKIGLSGEMEDQWWAWWKGINPSWRWDVLKCPGQNGLLNVVITLKWWHGSMETPSESWEPCGRRCGVGAWEDVAKCCSGKRPNDAPRPPPPIARPARRTERPAPAANRPAQLAARKRPLRLRCTHLMVRRPWDAPPASSQPTMPAPAADAADPPPSARPPPPPVLTPPEWTIQNSSCSGTQTSRSP
ncbi:hypothetical protein B0H14DRAFT_3462540 [Mycena olivaceomarginata]|nr:hypothetical protein B0H14DRAFT_3462540 [Mycena olivaceomarginata]